MDMNGTFIIIYLILVGWDCFSDYDSFTTTDIHIIFLDRQRPRCTSPLRHVAAVARRVNSQLSVGEGEKRRQAKHV